MLPPVDVKTPHPPIGGPFSGTASTPASGRTKAREARRRHPRRPASRPLAADLAIIGSVLALAACGPSSDPVDDSRVAPYPNPAARLAAVRPEELGDVPRFEITVLDPDRIEPGSTLLSLQRVHSKDPESPAQLASQPGLLALVDAQGQLLWIYRTDFAIADFEVLANGHLLLLTENDGLTEIDWLGETHRRWLARPSPAVPRVSLAMSIDAAGLHDDIEELPSGNLLVLANEEREVEDDSTGQVGTETPRGRRRVIGDRILEIDPATGEIVWSWSTLDHLDPLRAGFRTHSSRGNRRDLGGTLDHSHGNSLAYDPGDDSVVVTLRNLSATLKILRATSEIRWLFGDPNGWERLADRTFELASGSSWPHQTAAAAMTPGGTLLLFDSGNDQARPLVTAASPEPAHSRAVEYLIDDRIRIAGEIWASEVPGSDPVISVAGGNVDLLPMTGNRLVSYGAVVDHAAALADDRERVTMDARGSLVREVTGDTPPRLVWELLVRDRTDGGGAWAVTGVERLPGIPP